MSAKPQTANRPVSPVRPDRPDDLPFRSANEVWTERVVKSAEQTAFRYSKGGSWTDLTWRESDVIAREIAAGLSAIGIRPADRVCILSQTRVEWLLCDVGILQAGAVSVPIYPSSTADQCAYIVRDAGARAVVVEDAAQLAKLLPLLHTGADLHLIYLDGSPDILAGVAREAVRRVHSLEQLREQGRSWRGQPSNAAESARRHAAPGLDDPFTIIYTSGTTGNPKGVVLTHRNLIAGCTSAARAITLGRGDVQYLWLTLAHVIGRQIAWAPVFLDIFTVFTEGVTRIKENLLTVRPTFMACVPRIYEKLYAAVQAGMQQGSGGKRALVAWAFRVGGRYARTLRDGGTPGRWLRLQHRLADRLVLGKLRAKLGLDRCRVLLSGGAPLAQEIAEFFHAAGLLILEAYGLTETMAAAFVNRFERYRLGTVGVPIDVLEHQIAEDGEILMRGPSVFRGYHGNPQATAEAIDAEGWFHSGDIGQIEDGFLRITDRKKDLIVLATGKKVPPQMVENALKARCPLLSQVLVHGDRKSYLVALLTLAEETVKKYGDGDPQRAAASKELEALLAGEIAALNAGLANFETIKRFAVLSEDFTEQNGQLTPSLKVKRKVVVERHRAVIEGLYLRDDETAAPSISVAAATA